MTPEQGDLVLCTVERIDGTIVFVKVLFENKEIEGSIVTSEIAPGRIRNIRDYVVPKKKIVCKILRVSGTGNVELSLRRVSQKETKEVMDKYHQEMAYLSILKKAVGEKYGDIVAKIKEESDLSEFFAEAKLDSKKLEKLVGKNAGKIIDILKSEKQKKAVIKKEIILKSESPDGVHMIKKTLGSGFNAEIFYIGSGKYSIKTEAQEMKKADAKLREILGEIEKRARENKMIFSIREK